MAGTPGGCDQFGLTSAEVAPPFFKRYSQRVEAYGGAEARSFIIYEKFLIPTC